MKQKLLQLTPSRHVRGPVFATSVLLWACLSLAGTSQATEYYCDPVNGSMSNDGSFDNPWGTLEAVFLAGKTFAPGDIIFMRSGNHGFPRITGKNTDFVIIKPQSGHTPLAKKLRVIEGQNWIISGIVVSPETAGIFEKDAYVAISSNSTSIILRECNVYSTSENISHWTATDVVNRFGNGIWVGGTNCTISENNFTQIRFGIEIAKSATGAIVTGNVIAGFSGDAIRGLADNATYEYNIIKNAYKVDNNHDDGFQSWSTNASGQVGKGVVKDVVLRSNTIIAQTDPAQPFPGSTLQGIGCFDGFFENWTVENNIVITDMWHGISFYGATNCKIVNNTVVKNPLNVVAAPVPWIGIYNHKDGRLSTGNIVRNNLTSDISSMSGAVLSNNIKTSAYNFHFVNYGAFDLHLKARSTAVNAGTTLNAPATDLEQYTRSIPYDIGAFEYRAEADTSHNDYADIPGDAVYDDSLGVIGRNTWRSFFVSEQTRGFTAAFDAVPNKDKMDGITGVLKGSATTFGKVACIVRFNPSGRIDVRKGSTYAADTTVGYTADTRYRFRMAINVVTKTYSVYVTPEGQDEITLAINYAFRTEQTGVTSLDSWTLYSVTGSHTVSNMTFTTDTEPPVVIARNIVVSLDSTGQATITPEQVNNGSTDNVGISSYRLDKTVFGCSDIGNNQVILTATDYNGNTGYDTATVTVVGVIPDPVITVSRTDTTFTGLDENSLALGYGAQELILTADNSTSATGSTDYLWTPADNLSNVTGASTVFTPPAAGTYTYSVVATNEFGCTASRDVSLHVIDARCGNNNDKVLVLHHTDSDGHSVIICVSANAVPDFLGAGDQLADGSTPSADPEGTGLKTSLAAYPNPFQGGSTISFTVACTSQVVLDLYNPSDGQVKKLFEGIARAGQTYAFNFNGSALPAGIYLIRLTTPQDADTFQFIKTR